MKKLTKIGIAALAVTLLAIAANTAMAATCYTYCWYDAWGNYFCRWICYP